MTIDQKSGFTRRDFLQLSWSLAAGAAVPGLLSACGGSSTTPEVFDPPVLQSTNGLLDVTLKLQYVDTVLSVGGVEQNTHVRSFNGMIPAPTLRVHTGDTLRIKIVNGLPPNPPTTEPAHHLRYPNSTNLHTHGLHVTPGLVAPGIFGDFVVDDPDMGVHPGESRQHEFKIGPDHPAGAYFYHPHLHGATAIQMGSGMSGMLIISGAINEQVPEIAAARERVFVFQRPIVDKDGTLENFGQMADFPANETNFLCNGMRIPRLLMKSGEVQNWHMVNAGIFNILNIVLEKHTLNLYSQDGNPRANLKPIGDAGPEGVVIAPGNRASVLVKAGAPGLYKVKTLAFQMGGSANSPVGAPQNILPEDIVAEVFVTDDVKNMSLPTRPLPVPAALAPITDQELAAAGGLKRNIVFRAVNNPPDANFNKPPVTDPPANASVHPGDELADWVFNSNGPRGSPTTIQNTVFGIGSPSGGSASASPGVPTPTSEIIPFQSRRALKQTVPLGSVEEWTIFNMNVIRHPFHIHVNPIYITKINGKAIEPYWADTIALPAEGTPDKPTSVTFRTRFENFKGLTVLHCHMLVHEDMGMMQAVDIV